MRRHAIAMLGVWMLACRADEPADAQQYTGDPTACAGDDCDVACDGAPIACVPSCEVGADYEATCESGVWSCGTGVVADECPSCVGAPSICIEACGSDVEVGEAVCEAATWTCTEGVVATSCAPCEGEEPLECVVSCDEGEIYESRCIDDTWDCGDGTLLEGCGVACGDETQPCPEGCGGDASDPWLCVPSCEVFEIYDAACVGDEWSCGDGVLAADC